MSTTPSATTNNGPSTTATAAAAGVKTYHGSCLCKAVTYSVEIDFSTQPSGKCNCSQCAKKRNWSSIVKPEAFHLITPTNKEDPEVLTDYQRYPNMHSPFCKTCGIRAFAWGFLDLLGGDFVSVNIAALDGFSQEELDQLPVQYMNGLENAWMDTPKHVQHL